MEKIRIGTRGSKLALWQAYYVQDRLQAQGIDSEIITIETKGDKVLDVSIAKIGSKGVFTEEIEEQLRQGQIDIAVHSAKDMPSELPQGFSLIAFSEREKEHDVLVSTQKGLNLSDASRPLVVGTSSTRRVAILKRFYPHIRTVEVRGNLQTRIRKMEEGACDALLLAYAGVHRMGYEAMIQQHLPLAHFTPAAGQGSVAIEVYENLSSEKRQAVRAAINHPATEQRLLAERAYLHTLEGGCSIPSFALAEWKGDLLQLRAGLVSLDGSQWIVKEESAPAEQAEALGHKLAQAVLAEGGKAILAEIKKGKA
ncbi:hydroxymethylbilane synthase [Cytophagales bacterium LB-30]|uniref:Porphobilinogen deaminase n=1 Tax=Shiella aurantiaca TaxID=3058365 RepID=A0ABT8F8F1_9BACT|nr:hydroxymethylbilane synthase [Shiella aurantiaca]MDN4166756.1 hydroxymethylbilane synthase [Shiella aurantiaca]